MRSRLLPALLAASLSLAGAAYASTSTTGQIKALDMTAHTVTLSDGTVFQMPAGYKDPGLKVGDKVAIVWEMKGKAHEASSITRQK